jgi:hypothetical protein
VSTLIIFIGAATPSKTVNLSIVFCSRLQSRLVSRSSNVCVNSLPADGDQPCGFR